MSGHSVSEWLELLKMGDCTGTQQLWQRYAHRLTRLADRRLGGFPRRLEDEEDVAHSAFSEFVLQVNEGRFAQMKDRHDLWQVLAVLIHRKATRLMRHETALRRDVRRCSQQAVHETRALSGNPTQANDPSATIEADDLLKHLLDLLSDDKQRQVALARLQGFTNREIADQLDCGERSVERKLSIIRRKWRACLGPCVHQ